jgi:hypothetical protein
LPKRSGGETSSPEQVKRFGMVPPSSNAGLVIVSVAGACGSGLPSSPPPQPAIRPAAIRHAVAAGAA